MIERELRLAAVDRAYRDHVADVYRMAYAILREPESASEVATCRSPSAGMAPWSASWRPTANWMAAPGKAVDTGGSLVVDAAMGSSLTVLDAATGEVRAVAGMLGSDYLTLDPALVP